MVIKNMIKNILKNKRQKGYAMLFAVIIVSAISVITAGLINATYKQMMLSSLAKNSQSAFYQADTASDCALYADRVYREEHPQYFEEENGGPFVCGGYKLKIRSFSKFDYIIYPEDLESSDTESCFRINVTKTLVGTETKTIITAKGYNICNLYNKKTVERSIKIDYTE